MPVTPITDWGAAVISSAAAALALFLAGIPKVIGFLIILVVGWLVAGAIAGIVARLLAGVRFDDLARRSGIAGFVEQMGLGMTPSRFLGEIAKWFVRLITLVVAFDALGLPAVSQVLQQFLLWLPNLVVAVIALVIGGLAANALGRLVRGAAARSEVGNAELLGTITSAAVWAFAIVVAVNQIGIASNLVNTLFMGVVAALALAFGLAFGLGGRDTAARLISGWYERGRTVAPRAARLGEAARDEAREAAGEMTMEGNGRRTAQR